MKGLVVDPSKTYQDLLSTAIESDGIETTQVSTGSEALESVGAKQTTLTTTSYWCSTECSILASMKRLEFDIVSSELRNCTTRSCDNNFELHTNNNSTLT